MPPNPKVTVEEDGLGGRVFLIDRGDTQDAYVTPAPVRTGADVPMPDATLSLMEQISYEIPKVDHNFRRIVIGRDYVAATDADPTLAGNYVRVADVLKCLQTEAMLRPAAAQELLALARGIARACGFDDER